MEEGFVLVKVHPDGAPLVLGWRYREIAAFEGINEDAVSKRIERFRKKLKSLGI